MKRPIYSVPVVLILCLAAADWSTTKAASEGAHTYFDTLVSSPAHWKSFSLRDPAQLDHPKNGGYAHSNTRELDVTYDPVADAAKVLIRADRNSLQNQVRLPINTEDGHTYLFVWDGYWTASYLPVNTGLTNHKAFQFSSGTDSLWLEPQTRFDGGRRAGLPVPDFDPRTMVAGIEARYYGTMGPGTTYREPLEPKNDWFALMPNRWTRFWVLLDTRGEYDVMSMWVADEQQQPKQIYKAHNLTMSGGGVAKFWLEFNTSTNTVREGRGDLIAYVRNVVVLRNAGNVEQLLQRPGVSTPIPTPTQAPAAPRNVRIVG